MASSMAPLDMTDIPAEYHNFADVFRDSLSEKLPEHRPYDVHIQYRLCTNRTSSPDPYLRSQHQITIRIQIHVAKVSHHDLLIIKY